MTKKWWDHTRWVAVGNPYFHGKFIFQFGLCPRGAGGLATPGNEPAVMVFICHQVSDTYRNAVILGDYELDLIKRAFIPMEPPAHALLEFLSVDVVIERFEDAMSKSV